MFVYYTGKGQRVPRGVVSVRFHPSVTEVEEKAFAKCIKLKEVVLNEGLTVIGSNAFSKCKAIVIPSTVLEIGVDAFCNCRNLREVVLNEGLQRIGGRAFSFCKSLESIALPSTLAELCAGAFLSCTSLIEVVLNVGLKKIEVSAFMDCQSLESITIPSTVTEIGILAFHLCTSLRKVELHEGLQRIWEDGLDAFASCSSLERFSFPNISTRLGDIIRGGHYPRVETKVDDIRGDMIERRGSELFVPGAVRRESYNWFTIKASLDQIISQIKYYEIKEATTLFELALWKASLNQEEGNSNRDACRIDVPGPVKGAILQYL